MGKDIDVLMQEATKTSDFEIAYTVMLPKMWDSSQVPGGNDDKSVILMLHGVPTSRKWKYHMMEIMAKRGCIVVACDLLGMGESTQVMDYRRFGQSSSEDDANSAWDWKHDVEWLRDFITREILSMGRLGFQDKKDVIVAADDWGAGPAEWLFAEAPDVVRHLMLINPIHLDGYFVIEIGTIGRTDAVRRKKGNAAFQQGAFTLPQVILGIEKYMIQDRKRMNRYTESSFMSQYQETNYQEGKTAAEMQPNYWNLAVLAARASRLAPRQLQPYHPDENPRGLAFSKMPRDKPTDIIWGIEDQMMPPIQMWRSVYAFPGRLQTHPIANADHFSEVDQPYRVADAMTSAILREDRDSIPIFLGDNPEFVYKGDEAEMRERLAATYSSAPTFAAPKFRPAPSRSFPVSEILLSEKVGVMVWKEGLRIIGSYNALVTVYYTTAGPDAHRVSDLVEEVRRLIDDDMATVQLMVNGKMVAPEALISGALYDLGGNVPLLVVQHS